LRALSFSTRDLGISLITRTSTRSLCFSLSLCHHCSRSRRQRQRQRQRLGYRGTQTHTQTHDRRILYIITEMGSSCVNGCVGVGVCAAFCVCVCECVCVCVCVCVRVLFSSCLYPRGYKKSSAPQQYGVPQSPIFFSPLSISLFSCHGLCMREKS